MQTLGQHLLFNALGVSRMHNPWVCRYADCQLSIEKTHRAQ